MSQMNNQHTFALCAYKESPYLEACIQSLLKQRNPSKIILATSTPCEYIENMCKKYDIPYYVNHGESGITQDWTFAYKQCTTPIVTIAHQDDIYYENYVEELLKAANKAKQPIIFSTDYDELREGEIVHQNTLLKIKRIMMWPLRFRIFQKSVWVRRRILSFGCPICCPSVAYFTNNMPDEIFKNHFRTNEDWEAWENLSRRKGEFLYVGRPLMAHRIHEESETSASIRETGRGGEDMEMYEKFWPKWIAKLLCGFYQKSEDSNNL
ncbi:MAG: glycosyltransferase [Lachnospiraceae bacterium]